MRRGTTSVRRVLKSVVERGRMTTRGDTVFQRAFFVRACAPANPLPRWDRIDFDADGGRPGRVEDDEKADTLRTHVLSTKRREKNTPASQYYSMLTDTFGRHHDYLRVSLTERCNLRCLYCMPEDGIDLAPKDDLLTTEEIERLVKLFAREGGVRKVRLTGGEPTVRKDLVDIVERITKIDGIEHVAMTTNGIALKSKLDALKRSGLKSINVSLDSLVKAKFEFMTRRDGLEKVLNSIDEAVRIGIETVKVNVVVVRGQNDDELLDFVKFAKDKPVNVRFIEYMPFNGNKWETRKMVSYAEMFDTIQNRYPSIARIPDETKSEVGKNFQIDGFKGTVSFVTSMTNHFCGGCNRLRILADGNLKVCLFGNAEVSLRDAMRVDNATDDELKTIVEGAVKRKKAKHAGMENLAGMENRSMIRIGG